LSDSFSTVSGDLTFSTLTVSTTTAATLRMMISVIESCTSRGPKVTGVSSR
jgi:hypothetical protein